MACHILLIGSWTRRKVEQAPRVVQGPQGAQERRVSWAPMLHMPYKEDRETIWSLPWLICPQTIPRSLSIRLDHLRSL